MTQCGAQTVEHSEADADHGWLDKYCRVGQIMIQRGSGKTILFLPLNRSSSSWVSRISLIKHFQPVAQWLHFSVVKQIFWSHASYFSPGARFSNLTALTSTLTHTVYWDDKTGASINNRTWLSVIQVQDHLISWLSIEISALEADTRRCCWPGS